MFVLSFKRLGGFLVTVLGLVTWAVSTPALAQDVALTGTVMLEQSVTRNGAETTELVEPKSVVPGDHLMISTVYRNGGAKDAENVVVTNAIPPAVSFAQAESANGFKVSVDGGKTWGDLAALTISDQGRTRPATPADVTHVRWTIAKVAPGAQGKVEFRGIVK